MLCYVAVECGAPHSSPEGFALPIYAGSGRNATIECEASKWSGNTRHTNVARETVY